MLGEYKLNEIYNEDCYEAIKKIPDKSVDLIIIDPPYEFSCMSSGKMLIEKGIKNMIDSINENNLGIGIDEKIFGEIERIMKKINIYVWCNKTMIPKLIDYYVLKKGCNFDILSWHKPNAMPMVNNKYLTDTEYCLYFRKNTRINTTCDTGKTYFLKNINVKDKQLYNHPTIKPIEIIKNLIINSSNKNDIVADFFLGSGTTCVAAKELGRQYIGFEIDKQYYEIAKNRLNGINANGQISIFTNVEQNKLDL